MTTVYVIIASRGDYSARAEWPVLVVHSEERAQELVETLDVKAREEYIDEQSRYQQYEAEYKRRGLSGCFMGPRLREIHGQFGSPKRNYDGYPTHHYEVCEMERPEGKSAEVA